MQTEAAAARFSRLEEWTTAELVDALAEGQFTAIAAVHAARHAIAEAIDRAAARLRSGEGRLVYLGAGTSGRIAAQDAAELAPTFGWPMERALALMAGGDAAFSTAIEGAEDGEDEAPRRLASFGLGPADVAIGLAASGRTPFTVAGLRHARERGALTIAVQNNPGGPLAKAAELEILLETGAEPLAGSTRMKAGTAQKVALNSFSTGIMMKLGFVYRGQMVGMRATNDKLRERAVEIVVRLTGAGAAEARAALAATEHAIPAACIVVAKGCGAAEAEAILRAAGGDLGRALG